MIKPAFQQPIDKFTYEKTIGFFEKLMQLAHPFVPFITEEIWHALKERSAKDCITVSSYPQAKSFDETVLKKAETAKEIISRIRDARGQAGISPKEELPLSVLTANKAGYDFFKGVIMKLACLKSFEFTDADVADAKAIVVGGDKLFLQIQASLNPEEERKKIAQEIDYMKGFIKSVSAKLSNERFVNGAPAAVIEKEKQKLADGKAKLKALEESLARLN
jgi:valyl-tRNA synthetase